MFFGNKMWINIPSFDSLKILTIKIIFFKQSTYKNRSLISLSRYLSLTHISLSSWPVVAAALWFWASCSICCSRCLFLIPRQRDSNSMATPEPTSTNATDDALFFLLPVSQSGLGLVLPLPLSGDMSGGTTLHTIITMPKATSPTPRAHSAYCEPEFPLFSLLVLGMWPVRSLPCGLRGPFTLGCISSVPKCLSQ